MMEEKSHHAARKKKRATARTLVGDCKEIEDLGVRCRTAAARSETGSESEDRGGGWGWNGPCPEQCFELARAWIGAVPADVDGRAVAPDVGGLREGPRACERKRKVFP